MAHCRQESSQWLGGGTLEFLHKEGGRATPGMAYLADRRVSEAWSCWGHHEESPRIYLLHRGTEERCIYPVSHPTH